MYNVYWRPSVQCVCVVSVYRIYHFVSATQFGQCQQAKPVIEHLAACRSAVDKIRHGQRERKRESVGPCSTSDDGRNVRLCSNSPGFNTMCANDGELQAFADSAIVLRVRVCLFYVLYSGINDDNRHLPKPTRACSACECHRSSTALRAFVSNNSI